MAENLSTNQEIFAALKANQSGFIATAKSIASAKMKTTLKAGEWSPAFVIHHMADADLHFASRYLFNLSEESPAIVAFNEDVYPDRLNYAERDPESSISAIEGLNKMVIDILSSISDQDWKRTSIHREKGPMTLAEIVALASGHAKAHTKQLDEIIGSY